MSGQTTAELRRIVVFIYKAFAYSQQFMHTAGTHTCQSCQSISFLSVQSKKKSRTHPRLVDSTAEVLQQLAQHCHLKE